MPHEFDCVVVGAGFAGAPLALGLAQLGLSVALVEQRAAPAASVGTGDARGLALTCGSEQLLAKIGLWPALAAHVTRG